MSTFFQQTAQAMIAKHIDRFPLLKLDQVIDWQPIEQYLNHQRTRYLKRPPRPSRLSPVVHVQSHPTRTIAQPLRPRTQTQPYSQPNNLVLD